MNRFELVQDLIANTLSIEKSRIQPGTLQAELPEWDSVAHLNLMLSLEDAFEVRLSVADMQRLTSLPQILSYLEAHGL